jgi:RHS repeat-associated protein
VDVPGDVLQENHFYAFGMELNYNWLNNSGLQDDLYKYAEMERNDVFGANIDLTDFRTYDPSVGRWIQVDTLSEIAPELNGYRNAFNNPINFVDPLGLFETKREAREYRRDNDIKGKIVKNREGRYEIRSRKSSGYIMRTEDGNIEAGAVAYAGNAIREYKPNWAEQIKESSFIGKFVYNTFDTVYVFLQDMNPFDTDNRHLDQTGTTYTERQESLASAVATLAAPLRGLSAVKSTMPQGLTIFNRLNSAQFSKVFKGAFITKLHPKIRGVLNKGMNRGVDQINNRVETGMIVIPVAKESNKIENRDN